MSFVFKTFERNEFIINVCCLKEDINSKKEIENLKFFMLKHGANRVYNKPDLTEIISLKKFCNSRYKFVFSKKTFFFKKMATSQEIFSEVKKKEEKVEKKVEKEEEKEKEKEEEYDKMLKKCQK